MLVESRPINKLCFRRIWREGLGLSFKPISQEDVEADYEKLERRSRIRTARARQINPQVIRKMDENKWRRSTFLAKKMKNQIMLLSQLFIHRREVAGLRVAPQTGFQDQALYPR